MVFVQKWPFFQVFFLGNIVQENVFYDILERKNAFLGYKNKNFKKSKNWHFCNRVNHGLGPKMAIFQPFFLRNIGQENVFYGILQRKIAFLRYKNIKLKKPKIDIFPWFWSNNGHFSNFFGGGQYRPGKCLLWYSRTKKRSSRL